MAFITYPLRAVLEDGGPNVLGYPGEVHGREVLLLGMLEDSVDVILEVVDFRSPLAAASNLLHGVGGWNLEEFAELLEIVDTVDLGERFVRTHPKPVEVLECGAGGRELAGAFVRGVLVVLGIVSFQNGLGFRAATGFYGVTVCKRSPQESYYLIAPSLPPRSLCY